MRSDQCKGFTLIEITIVLIVIGLLSGSILVAYSLVHTAELRATLKQVEMFDTAYNTFRLKYNCLPGDCANASDLGFTTGSVAILAEAEEEHPLLDHLNPISSAHAAGATGAAASTFDIMAGLISGMHLAADTFFITSVNGNGDGIIENYSLVNFESVVSLYLLYQANLITGFDATTSQVKLAINASAQVGPGKINNAFWLNAYFLPSANSLIKKPNLYYQAVATLYNYNPGGNPLIPSDAQALDSKFDDGFPLSGKIMSTSSGTINLINGPSFNPAVDTAIKGSPAATRLCILRQGSAYIYNTGISKNACATVISASM